MKIKDFVLSNKNTDVKWNIDGENFTKAEFIPPYIMDKYLYEWTVNQWEGIILIQTYLG